MKTTKIITLSLLIMLFSALSVNTSCTLEEWITPTNELMLGVWEMETVTEDGVDVTSEFNSLFPTYVHLDDMNSVNSTAGPLFMYLVYGKSKFISVTSNLDQVFDYANLTFTTGEWFIDKNETVDRFTVEVKLKFPGTSTLENLLNTMGISLGSAVDDILDAVIYHKFRNVKIEINDVFPETMTFEFDHITTAEYNTKNAQGDYVLYQGSGFSVDSFSRCRITFSKKVKTLTELVQDHSE
jgi:hypothetical protein